MYAFKYHQPKTVRQAANLLAKFPEAKVLAGGHSLIPVMKLRLASPSDIVDINGVEGLSSIEVKGRSVVIGAMARHSEVASAQVLKDVLPALAGVPGSIGDPHVRHRGTIGGSVANNDPNADYPAACLGLGATIITNKRRIAADDFFTGMFSTALEPDEIIVQDQLPARQEGGVPEIQAPGLGLRAGRRVRVEARRGHPCRGDGRRLERSVPRQVVRGGAQEALLTEVDRRPDRAGRRHELATFMPARNTARI